PRPPHAVVEGREEHQEDAGDGCNTGPPPQPFPELLFGPQRVALVALDDDDEPGMPHRREAREPPAPLVERIFVVVAGPHPARARELEPLLDVLVTLLAVPPEQTNLVIAQRDGLSVIRIRWMTEDEVLGGIRDRRGSAFGPVGSGEHCGALPIVE